MGASWGQIEKALAGKGYGEQEISDVGEQLRDSMRNEGYGTEEINTAFGIPNEPDMAPVRKKFEENFSKAAEAEADSKVKKDKDVWDALSDGFEAGAEGTGIGMALTGKPDTILPEDAGRAERIAAMFGAFAGDVPVMYAGGKVGAIAGAAAGTAVGGPPGALVGGVLGAGFGAFGAPAFLREIYVQHLKDKEFTEFNDYWDATSKVFIETMKGGVTGAVTFGVAGKVSKLAYAALPTSKVLAPAVVTGSEVAAMTTVGAALEGHMPSIDDAIDASIMIVGLKGFTKVADKALSTFGKTGVMPEELAREAAVDPAFRLEMMSIDKGIPERFLTETMQERLTLPKELLEKPEIFDAKSNDGLVVEPFENFTFRKEQAKQAAETFLSETTVERVTLPKQFTKAKPEAPEQHVTRHEKLSDPGIFTKAKSGELAEIVRTKERAEQLEEAQLDLLIRTQEKVKEAGGKHSPDVKTSDLLIIKDAKNSIEAVRRIKDSLPSGELIKKDPTTREKLEALKPEEVTENDVKATIKEYMTFQPLRYDKSPDIGTPFFSAMYTALLDKGHPIRLTVDAIAGKHKVEVKDDAHQLFLNLKGAPGRADQMLETSVTKFGDLSSTTIKGLMPSIKPIAKDQQMFSGYLAFRRAVDLEAVGKKSGFPLGVAQAAIKMGKSKFEQSARDVTAFRNGVLDYVVDSGALSPKMRDLFRKMNEHYVPLYRLSDEGSAINAKGKGVGIRAFKGAREGSITVDPIESIARDTYKYVEIAERQRMISALVELQKKFPETNIVEVMPVEMSPIRISDPELVKFLKNNNIEATPDMLNALVAFRPRSFGLANNEVPFYIDGKMRRVRVPKEVAEAVRKLDDKTLHPFTQFISHPARLKRAGIVLEFAFGSKNFIRDTLMAMVNTRNIKVISDSITAMGSIVKKDVHYQEWLKTGSADAHLLAMDQRLGENIFKLSKETALIDGITNIVKDPLMVMRVTGSLMENATRVGVFTRARKRGSTLEEAAKLAREGTVDFGREGAKMRAFNVVTPFLKIGMQGHDRMFRAFRDNPGKTSLWAAGTITIPSLMLLSVNMKDARWPTIPDLQKDLTWIIMTDDWQDADEEEEATQEFTRIHNGVRQINRGTIWRIPKPFELGIIFGSLPERVMEGYLTDNPDALGDIWDTLIEGAVPNYMPAALEPIVEDFANRSRFTKRVIIPGHLEGISPKYQYRPYTSETAKLAGRFLQENFPVLDEPGTIASPAILENYFRAWTGGLGGHFLDILDKGLIAAGVIAPPVKPATTMFDIPFVKSFLIRTPSMSAQPVQDFYDVFETAKIEEKTLQFLNRLEDATQFEQELDAQEARNGITYSDVSDIRKSISEMSRAIQEIVLDPEMTAEDKRQLIDTLTFNIIEEAQFGLDRIKDIEEESEEFKEQERAKQ